jgi:SAM-dependent methyltransferase
MTQYLISFDGGAMNHIPDADMPAVAKAAHAVVQEALNAGVWVLGGGMEYQKASIVATDGTVTDVPYPQAIGGMSVVEVSSREEALEWAAKIAVACRCAQEVREFMPDPELAAMLHQADSRRRRKETSTGDPYSGRLPTSHERMAGRPWDASYTDGPAPWDTGQPQPALVRLAARAVFTGEVLDAGCGLGENALYIASLGVPVLGFDVAETALAAAREQADERGLAAEFIVADALRLDRLGRRFATVMDSGLFHAFDGEERLAYAASLASATESGATLYVLCFSDGGPDTGPHPVSQEDLREAFNAGTGWDVVAIEPERVSTRFHDDNGAPGWLATIKRI